MRVTTSRWLTGLRSTQAKVEGNHRLWKWSTSLCGGLVGWPRRGGSFIRDFERKVKFYFDQETLFIGDSGRYVKESAGNVHLSPRGPHWGTWRVGGGLFYRWIERQMKECSGNETSLSAWTLQGETRGRAFYWLPWRICNRKTLEMGISP